MVRRRSLPFLVVLTGVVVGLVTGVTAVVLAVDRPAPGSSTDLLAPRTGQAARLGALGVLRDWDRARARAFARDDETALAALYVAGSRTGLADQRVLAGYRERGLRVIRMTTQVLAAAVLREQPARIEMVVTDVLADAAAVDADGSRWALPHDRPTTRRVVFVRSRDRWLVAEAYPAG
jgi:hypothetical protein